MSLKRKIVLTAPVPDAEGLNSLAAFNLDYLYVFDDHLGVRLNPNSAKPINFYPPGATDDRGTPIVTGKNLIVLTPAQLLKVQNFIQAIEDACQTNLNTAWP